jgi:hypothetical protein
LKPTPLNVVVAASMPVRKYIPGSAFDPETIAHMVRAFETLRVILNFDERNDPLVEDLAKRIISLASRGITDPEEIIRRVIADID